MPSQRPTDKAANSSTIFALSDATASTAEQALRAAMAQFPSASAKVRIFPRVRDSDHLRRVLDEAVREQAFVLYTLVDPSLRAEAHEILEAYSLHGLDLFGPLLHHLGKHLGHHPAQQPGLRAPLDSAYFQRIAAVEFAMKNDDGKSPHHLERADIVLVGVSRTSKTPVSAILAGRGYLVANVPLVPGIEPPQILFSLPPGKVFGLTIDPMQLKSIRKMRLATMGVGQEGDYTDEEQVFSEVRWALDLHRRRGKWPLIDVTNMAVEETAAEILKKRFAILKQSAQD